MAAPSSCTIKHQSQLFHLKFTLLLKTIKNDLYHSFLLNLYLFILGRTHTIFFNYYFKYFTQIFNYLQIIFAHLTINLGPVQEGKIEADKDAEAEHGRQKQEDIAWLRRRKKNKESKSIQNAKNPKSQRTQEGWPSSYHWEYNKERAMNKEEKPGIYTLQAKRVAINSMQLWGE